MIRPLLRRLERLVRGNERDGPVRRLLKNAFVLLSGDAAGTVLGALAFFLTARSLDPVGLGLIILAQSFSSTIDTIVNFRCWRIVVKYGADALEADDRSDFLSVIKLGVLLDVGSSIVGAIATVLLAFILPAWLDADPIAQTAACFYAIPVLLRFSGTADGLLRLFDNFLPFAYRSLIVGAGKLFGVGVCYALDASLWGFLAVWIATTALSYLVIVAFGLAELRRQGYTFSEVMGSRVAGIGTRHPGIWHFAVFTHIGSSLRIASRKLDDFVVQKLLGTEAVGMYVVAKKFALVLRKAYGPLSTAIYPELARSHARAERATYMRGLLGGIGIGSAIAVPVFLVIVALAPQIITWTVGAEYLPARPLILPFMGAACIELIFFGMQSAVLAMGMAGVQLFSYVLSTAVYFTTMWVLVPLVGLPGIGYAQLGLAVSYASFLAVVVALRVRHWKDGEPPPWANEASHEASPEREA